MTVINPPGYMQNLSTHTAQVDRIAAIGSGMAPSGAGLTWRGGVRGAADMKVAAQGSPNMTVAVAAGLAFVLGTQNAFQGLYTVPNDASVNVTITAAHATLVRWDLIVVRVQDQFYSGASNTATIEVVTGTASASPTDPALPANSLVIGRVRVAAAATSITNAMIDDIRTWTASLGGYVLCLSTNRPTASDGLAIYEIDTDRAYIYNGTTWMVVSDSGVWQTYTTALTTGGVAWVVGNGALVASYTMIGNTVHFRIRLTVGSSSSFTAGAVQFTLPFNQKVLLGVTAIGMSVGPNSQTMWRSSSTGLTAVLVPYLPGAASQATVATMGLVSGTELVVTGTYEV